MHVNQKKILIVFGTRPEAIKMAPLITVFNDFKAQFDLKVCITGQHKEILQQVLDFYEISPDFDLKIMKKKQSLTEITTSILIEFGKVIRSISPNLVIVHGDTSTTFAATLASFYEKIPIAHVEAGLRTNNIYNPWPEEANRRLTSSLAKYHFVPTVSNKSNLLKENINEDFICITGNTVIDSLLYSKKMILNNASILEKVIRSIKIHYDIIENKKYILITCHRRENFGDNLENICGAIKKLADNNHNVDFIYPVHPNPNIKDKVSEMLGNVKNIFLIPPVNYPSFIYLMDRSYFIISDSGGIQEEAPALGKPVLVIRESTERQEAVDSGTVELVGTSKNKIFQVSNDLLHNENKYLKMANATNPYGKGTACKTIIRYLLDKLE